ncbi:hypothetical protein R1flu_014741 [Riccia fluitans]|uniref:AIG1-type G domain-containing protein n=1 Tax=Riccia fluitans TaxID=41844 RepID=A0ABD1YHS9_9MARC
MMIASLRTLNMELSPVGSNAKLRRRAGITHEFEENFEDREKNSKAVVLFGRTGEDKTNVATALIRGGPGFESGGFTLQGDGHSMLVQTQSGRSWSVTDTIGGLSPAEAEKKSRFEALEIVTKFLMNLRGEYSHIIYTHNAVVASSTVDHLLWLAFEQIFAGAEEAYVVLYTGGDEKWLETHRSMQPDYLKLQTVLVTDISPGRFGDERKQGSLRANSNSKETIEVLEKKLEEIVDRRKRKYLRPFISDMDEEMLRHKAETLLVSLAENIQSRLHPNLWMKVACKFSTFFPIVWYFRELGAA